MSTDPIVVRVAGELRALLPRFLDNRRTDVRELEAALERRDSEAIRRIGHQLKGAGGGYGFGDITRLGGDIESDARRSEYDRLARHIDELKRYLEAVQIVFE